LGLGSDALLDAELLDEADEDDDEEDEEEEKDDDEDEEDEDLSRRGDLFSVLIGDNDG
jgi:hypothetical protein